MTIGDSCWRGPDGVAVLELPWRVHLPDGTTRTDPSQWAEDADVLAATGWARSTLTEADIAAMTPPEPAAPTQPPSWATPAGWRMSMTAESVSAYAALYLLASRRQQLGQSRPVVVIDTTGERHEMPFSEFDALMLSYGQAVEAQHGAA